MILYRALTNLEKGNTIIPAGCVFPGNMIGENTASTLLELGMIDQASAPPLEMLPGWTIRARKLSKINVNLAEQLFDQPNDQLAVSLKVPEAQIQAWKQSVLEFLKAPEAIC